MQPTEESAPVRVYYVQLSNDRPAVKVRADVACPVFASNPLHGILSLELKRAGNRVGYFAQPSGWWVEEE